MADAEGVVFAFATLGKAGEAVAHAQPAHPLAATGEDLVRIALVADVPDQPVIGGVEDTMQGQGQLDRTEIGREMATGLGDRFDQELAQLGGEGRQLLALQAAQVGRRGNAFQQRIGRGSGHVQNCRWQMKSASWIRRLARSPNTDSADRASVRSSSA